MSAVPHQTIPLGYEVGTGAPVSIPLRHLAVTGQTQQSGKTTTLEALIQRSGLRAIAFVTKRAESGFHGGHTVAPYFRARADWQFVSDILGSRLGEKLKFQRSWIMKVCRSANSLEDVQRNVRTELASAKRGLDQSVYTELDEYLSLVIPELRRLPYESKLLLGPGLNVMDLAEYSTSLQMLVISSVLERIYEAENNTVTIIPEAWEFVPQKRSSPVMRAAEALIRKSAAAGNYVWLDSQDIAGVSKDILRHCSVWILGVQREENEVKRTLANLGAGQAKPKPDDIRSLGKGEFFACWGKEMKRVYVQPAWMNKIDAHLIAKGQMDVSVPTPLEPFIPCGVRGVIQRTEELKDKNVDFKQRYEAAQEEVTRLRNDLATVQQELRDLRNANNAKPLYESAGRQAVSSGRVAPIAATEASGKATIDDAIYQEIRARLLRDPMVLKVLATQPEIRVEVRRETVEVNGNTLRGRLARLIAEGFFDKGAKGNAAHVELVRRGQGTSKPNVYKECDNLTTMGFLLKTAEDGYTAVPAMKRNIVLREAGGGA